MGFDCTCLVPASSHLQQSRLLPSIKLSCTLSTSTLPHLTTLEASSRHLQPPPTIRDLTSLCCIQLQHHQPFSILDPACRNIIQTESNSDNHPRDGHLTNTHRIYNLRIAFASQHIIIIIRQIHNNTAIQIIPTNRTTILRNNNLRARHHYHDLESSLGKQIHSLSFSIFSLWVSRHCSCACAESALKPWLHIATARVLDSSSSATSSFPHCSPFLCLYPTSSSDSPCPPSKTPFSVSSYPHRLRAVSSAWTDRRSPLAWSISVWEGAAMERRWRRLGFVSGMFPHAGGVI